jgi:hypothetical protein
MMNYKSPLLTELSTSTIEELLLVYLHHHLYNGGSRDLILGGGAIAIKNANEEKPCRFSEVLVVQKIIKK